MPLTPVQSLQHSLLENEQATNITLPYRLWQSYNTTIGTQDRRQDTQDDDLNSALQTIEAINAWHPEWVTHYIDFDLDMYTACTKQSRRLVGALRDLKENPSDSEKRTAYENAIEDLKQLSDLAKKENPSNHISKCLLGLSFTMALGLYLVFPAAGIIPTLINLCFFVAYMILVPLTFMAGNTAAIVPTAVFTLFNFGALLAATLGLIGLVLNISNPSPQGSVKLAEALDKLVTACEDTAPDSTTFQQYM
ncbi:MAG: hypothetical protein NXI01_05305 [Gammaproteobacteria bacterium]|nr:hypothetical protein [Gammaproteobacteria bacterium]